VNHLSAELILCQCVTEQSRGEPAEMQLSTPNVFNRLVGISLATVSKIRAADNVSPARQGKTRWGNLLTQQMLTANSGKFFSRFSSPPSSSVAKEVLNTREKTSSC